MKVILRNPRREIDVAGRRRVKELLGELGILPSTVLVIRDIRRITTRTLLTSESSSRKSWAAAKKRGPSMR